MPKIIAGAFLVAVLLALVPGVTHAQSATCAFPQADMAGQYVGSPALMAVEMTDCGGLIVTWSNPYGWHRAYYASMKRVPGGGISAVGFVADPNVGWLDNSYELLVKPAEPGYVQVFTARGGYYRLAKAN
jgi:hypothetical protein